MTQPTRTSKRVVVTNPSVPGGPAGNELRTLSTKSFVRSNMATACPKWRLVSVRFHLRTLANFSVVTPVAITVLVADMRVSL
ncbi:unannotated protein [freshwater metagenome]|uniref:Unannotated protein n=1 Tax=freshwater metagenome TaxID=449393 RepID=A0A6J6L3Y0_9ZZZZ